MKESFKQTVTKAVTIMKEEQQKQEGTFFNKIVNHK